MTPVKLPSRDQSPLTTDDTMLTIQQAADFLGVHYQTVRNWMRSGLIRYHKWGQTVRIPVSGLARRQQYGETARRP